MRSRVDADEPRRQPVAPRSRASPCRAACAQELPEREHDGERRAGQHPHALRQHRRARRWNGLVRPRRRDSSGYCLSNTICGQAAQEDRGADGDDDQRRPRRRRARARSRADAAHARRPPRRQSRAVRPAASGTPAATAKNVTMPPIITNSPCAKFIDVGRVVDQGEAERDQRIDRADRQPGKQELQEFGHGRAASHLFDRRRARARSARPPPR